MFFVMTLLHGGRQGGRRDPFLAQEMHFWLNICIFGTKSVFGTVLKGMIFFSPDHVVISKYQNLPMYPFQKYLSYAISYHF